MKPWFTKFPFALVACSLLCFAGCQSTSVVDTWKAPDLTKLSFKKVMVVTPTPDGVLRRSVEDAMKAQFTQVECVTSYALLGNEANLKDVANVVATLKSAGVDHVVLVRLISDRTEIYSGPSDVVPVAYRTFRGYYGAGYALRPFYYETGRISTDRIVQIETNIYEVAGERLVWSGATSHTNPASVRDLIDEAAADIRALLKKQGL